MGIFGPSDAEKKAQQDAAIADMKEDEQEAIRENAEAAKEKADMLAKWATKAGAAERCGVYANQIDDMISAGGMTHTARITALKWRLLQVVYEATHGELESFTYDQEYLVGE